MLRFISFLFLFTSFAAHAQYSLPDVPAAFNAISAAPEVLHLKRNHIKVPSGGHLQGIQRSPDSTFVITASSGTYSYYLTADRNQLISINKISDSPYRHAGGCQLYDRKLVAGVEDNQAKDKSDIVMVLFNDSMQQAEQHTVTHRSGSFKRSTAGAAGFTRLATGHYMVAVGDWDSRDIDFYISRTDGDYVFDSVSTLHIPPGQKWCSYQSINLLCNLTGRIYLIGFGLDGADSRADLFQVKIDPQQGASLKLINSRTFKCKGASFRYGAGIGTTPDGKLAIYSCSRGTSPPTTINIFK